MMTAHADTVATIRAGNKVQHGFQVDHYSSLLATPRIHQSHKPDIAHAWARSMTAKLQQGD